MDNNNTSISLSKNNIIKYKNFDCNELSLNKPIKDANYYCKLNYNNTGTFYIQTPELNINYNEETCKVTFNIVNKGQFVTVLEKVYEKIIQTLVNNSKQYFNGKQFTEDRIRSSFDKFYNIDESGNVELQSIYIDKNVNVYNVVKDKIKLQNGVYYGNTIINFNKIVFTSKKFYLDFSVTNIRLIANKKKIIDENFEDSEEEIENSKELEESTDEIKKIIITDNDILKSDDLDFF